MTVIPCSPVVWIMTQSPPPQTEPRGATGTASVTATPPSEPDHANLPRRGTEGSPTGAPDLGFPFAKSEHAVDTVESFLIWSDAWAEDETTETARVYRHTPSRSAVEIPLEADRTNQEAVSAALATIARAEARDVAAVAADVSRFQDLRRVDPTPYAEFKEGTTDPDLNRKIKEVIFVDGLARVAGPSP